METRKERPILMNTEMVKAILEGRKTQTRRLIAIPKPWLTQCKWYLPHPNGGWHGHDGDAPDAVPPGGERGFPCPLGNVGDLLWAKETFKHDDMWCSEQNCKNINHIWYRASERPVGFGGSACWRPSIHMPRWASRITLEVIKVRVERVQEISEEDALKEGVPYERWVGVKYHRVQFKKMWNSIYKNWDQNPWVWVVEFKVVE